MKFSGLHLFFIFPAILPFQSLISQEKKSESLLFGVNYTGDMVSNLTGGIKTGTTYLGMVTMDLAFDTEAADLWKGGSFYIKMANTHGGRPTQNFVGDFQGVSNIEAGNLTWLYECWYKHDFGKISTTIGLQDLNVNFASDDCAALFSNSSFGVQSSIADNIPSPIFPLTALGMNIKWQLSSSSEWKVALFDGTPDDFENNPYNLNWKLSRDQGFLVITEYGLTKSLIMNKSGNFKFGIYYHQHNDSIDKEQKNGGLYFSGHQQLTDRLHIFSQIGLSPKSINIHNHFYSLGLKYSGFSITSPDDFCGIALAYAGIDSRKDNGETAIELTYQKNFNSHFYIRPDIQYILNPSGTDEKLKNAFVAMLRFGVGF